MSCLCDDRFGTRGQVPTSACSMPCTGNSGEKCGNIGLNSIYDVSMTTIPISSLLAIGLVNRWSFNNNYEDSVTHLPLNT